MTWSIPIGTVKGTVIRLHITFLLVLAWIGAAQYARGGWEAAVAGVVFIAFLFLCVLLHEFGHIFAARRYGVQTPEVILLPIGGVARLERIPEFCGFLSPKPAVSARVRIDRDPGSEQPSSTDGDHPENVGAHV